MKTLLFATFLAVVSASPLPQSQIEQDAEFIPPTQKRTDADSSDAFPDSRQFPFFTPSRRGIVISLGDLPKDFFPFLSNRRRSEQPSAVGSPSFVDVPASSSSDGEEQEEEATTGLGPFRPSRPGSQRPFLRPGSSSFQNLWRDLFQLQHDMMTTLLGAPDRTNREKKPDDGTPDFPEDSQQEGTDLFDGIFNFGLGGGDRVPAFRPSSSFPGIRGGFPSFGDLPDNYDNSTYREEDVDGQVVQVNETIRKKTNDFGHSVFHFKVIRVRPDGTEEETPVDIPVEQVPDVQIPDVQIPDVQVQEEEEFSVGPGQPDVLIPTLTPEETQLDTRTPAVINEPKEEQPVVKENFGPIHSDGKGYDEQLPISYTPDDSVNEIGA